MSFKWIRNRKIISLILAVIFAVFLILLFNIACKNCLKGSWAKILISLFTVVIAIIELGDVFKKGKSRKIAIYISVAALFLVSVWDTGNESIEFSKEVEKRDSLITVDSLRFARIIDNLSTNIRQLDTLSNQIVYAFEEVVSIKKDVSEQKPILSSILNNTTESSMETKSLIEKNAPRIVFGKRYTKANFDHEGNLIIDLWPVNTGFGPAKNIKVFYQVFYATADKQDPTKASFRLVGPKEAPHNTYPKQWTTLEENYLTPSTGSYKNLLSLKPSLTKEDFLSKNNFWFVIYSVSCSDYRDKTLQKSLVITGDMNEEGQFNLLYNRIELELVKRYLDQYFGMGEYVFIESRQ